MRMTARFDLSKRRCQMKADSDCKGFAFQALRFWEQGDKSNEIKIHGKHFPQSIKYYQKTRYIKEKYCSYLSLFQLKVANEKRALHTDPL